MSRDRGFAGRHPRSLGSQDESDGPCDHLTAGTAGRSPPGTAQSGTRVVGQPGTSVQGRESRLISSTFMDQIRSFWAYLSLKPMKPILTLGRSSVSVAH